MGRGLVNTQKRPVGSSHGPEVTSGVQVVRGGQPATGYKSVNSQANNRTSIRSHSPGQNNFMQGPAQKAVKIQKAQIQSNPGVFGTNNLMFGNYGPGQVPASGVISSNGQPFQVKKQRGQSPYDRVN